MLVIALLLASVSCAWGSPKLSYIDTDVLCLLLAFMLVVAGLKQCALLDWLAVKLVNRCSGRRQLAAALVGLTYLASMFITNDVALLTFVPLTLVIGRTLALDMERTLVLQTLAANLGSMLTPPGNPQNLFLYAHYKFTPAAFFSVMALPALLSLGLLAVLLLRGREQELRLQLDVPQLVQVWRCLLFLALLLLNIAAVLHLLPKTVALLLTVAVVLLVERRLLLQADYGLLLTFAACFIFIGNISGTELITYLRQSLLGTAGGTYLAALLASQFISNVPAAMLLAGLTDEAEALLLGVNIGGLGTMIASMASLITYKLFAVEQPAQAGRYVRTFLYYNISALLLLGAAVYWLQVR